MVSTDGPAVAIVILNWNRPEDTAACLRSLEAQTYRNWQVIVVDNGSTDDSVPRLRADFPAVQIVVNERNLGFAGGCNVGVRRALDGAAEWVLLLNNDTVLDSRCLSELLDPRLSQYGILAPMIHHYDAPQRLWSAGARRGPGLPDNLREQDIRGDVISVDYVTGCAMLVRRTIFESVGLLDERFFMYYEDSEFCARARRAGHLIAVVPRARVWHKVGLSLRDDAPRERYLRMSSGVRFYRRELGSWRLALLGLWLLSRVSDALWRGCTRGSWPGVWATLRGIRDGFHQ